MVVVVVVAAVAVGVGFCLGCDDAESADAAGAGDIVIGAMVATFDGDVTMAMMVSE